MYRTSEVTGSKRTRWRKVVGGGGGEGNWRGRRWAKGGDSGYEEEKRNRKNSKTNRNSGSVVVDLANL